MDGESTEDAPGPATEPVVASVVDDIDHRARYAVPKRHLPIRPLILADAYRIAALDMSERCTRVLRLALSTAINKMTRDTLLSVTEAILAGRTPYPPSLVAEQKVIAGMLMAVHLRKLGLALLDPKVVEEPKTLAMLNILREADKRNLPPYSEEFSLFTEFAKRSPEYAKVDGLHGIWQYAQHECSGGEWFVAMQMVWETHYTRTIWGQAETLLGDARAGVMDWPARARVAADVVELAMREYDTRREAAIAELNTFYDDGSATRALFPDDFLHAFPELARKYFDALPAPAKPARKPRKRKGDPGEGVGPTQEANESADAAASAGQGVDCGEV